MESKMDSEIVVTKKAKVSVTLTNWQRLINAPILLSKASAVQWNEYLFVLSSDGTALLYHTKLKIWSMLCRYNHLYSQNRNIPLVNYKGKVLTIENNYQILTFDANSINWKALNKKPEHNTTNIAVSGNTLYAAERTKQWENFLFSLDNDEWKERSTLTDKDSKLFSTSEYVFEVTPSNVIYRYEVAKLLETESENATQNQKKIVRPPYIDYTLHVVKDTLFSFGGRDRDHQPTSDVLRYNPDTDTWESAGYMRSARYNVAVTTMQQGDTTEVYVLGGELGSTKLIMTPRLRTETSQNNVSSDWKCLTSIFEKCTLFE